MVVTAHPDDAEFGPAATAARWIDEGSTGWLVCCTSGDQGGEDPDLDPLRADRCPRGEQRRRGRDRRVCGGLLPPSARRRALANELTAPRACSSARSATFRPDAVLTHDPEQIFHRGGGVNHADHRAAGLAAVDAVYPAARNPMAFPALARNGLAPTGCAASTSSGPIGRTPGSTFPRRLPARSRPCVLMPARSITPISWPTVFNPGRPKRARRLARPTPRRSGW